MINYIHFKNKVIPNMIITSYSEDNYSMKVVFNEIFKDDFKVKIISNEEYENIFELLKNKYA